MIDINYKYAQWSTNVNTFGMNWQTYHDGKWYNPAIQTYDEAVDELKEIIRAKVLKDHPHLIAFENKINRPAQEVEAEIVSQKKLLEPTPKKSIEPQIDNSFDLLKEISNSKSTTFLKVFNPMCKTEQEKNAYDERFIELSASEGKPLLKTN